jgi:PAS domain S-box-containing protein
MDHTEIAIAKILDEFPCLLIGMDGTFRLKFLNQKATQILGYGMHDILSDSTDMLSVLLPSPKLKQQFSNYFDQNESGSISFHQVDCLHSSGEPRLINWIVRKRLEPVLRDIPFWFIGFDVTEEVNVKNKLKKNEERLALVSRATNDAVYEYDILENQISWIDGLSNTFGFDDFQEMKALDFWNLHLHPDDKDRVVAETRRAMRDEQVQLRTDEYRFLKRDGQYAIVHDKGIFIRNEEGHAIKMIGGLTDITSRKTIEKNLLDKNRRLSELAFFNSHKVRGPLARIMGLVNTIQDIDDLRGDEAVAILKNLRDASAELDDMIRQMTHIASQ